MAVEAVTPERLLQFRSCFYGGGGDADAPAVAPGPWPGLAPTLLGAASILSSCVNFLMDCSLLHCVLSFSVFNRR
jgi:hypothetical protein